MAIPELGTSIGIGSLSGETTEEFCRMNLDNGILDCVWVSTSGKLRVVRTGMSDSDDALVFFGMVGFIIN